jgi:hypothetical protein
MADKKRGKNPERRGAGVIVTPPRRNWPESAFDKMQTGAAPLSTSEILDFAEGTDSRP